MYILSDSWKLPANSTRRNRNAFAKLWKQKKSSELPNRPLTRSEVADFLKVSTRTIDRMCEYGKLMYWKLGPRYIRFNLDDVLVPCNNRINRGKLLINSNKSKNTLSNIIKSCLIILNIYM